MPRTIHVAHSPDSDDAFMFYALAAGKIDTDGIEYVHQLQDIETLNLRRPVYRQTAAYGHFGRTEPGFTWERSDKAEAIRKEVGSRGAVVAARS